MKTGLKVKAVSKNAIITPIVMKDGVEVRRYASKPQLQLDTGLDAWCGGYDWRSLDDYCSYGTGTQTLYRDSGTVTASQSGTTVTFSTSFAITAEVGGMIKWDSGEEAKITEFTDATHIEVDRSQTVESGAFGIHYTHVTSLASPSATSAKVTTFNTIEWDGTNTIHTRKYHHFAAVSSTTIVTELAYGPNTSTLHGIQNLASPVTLDPGEELVVQIDRYLVMPTATSTANIRTAGAVVATATAQLGNIRSDSKFWPFANADPYVIRFASPVTESFSLPGVSFDGSASGVSLGPYFDASLGSYSSGDFERTHTLTLASTVTGTFYGAKTNYYDGPEMLILFSTPLTKVVPPDGVAKVLKFSITFGVGRELVNE